MKRILIKLLSLAMISIAIFSSCEKTESKDPEYYSETQKQIFSMMHGSFVYEFYGIKTVVTFGTHYDKPLDATFEDGSKTEIHGEVTITYYDGSSFSRYYRLYSDGNRLSMYNKQQGISIVDVKDFRYVDENTFKWKELNNMVWDTYKRQ